MSQDHVPPMAEPVAPDGEAAFWHAYRNAGAPATHAIAAVVGVVFLLELLWGGSTSAITHYRMGANVPSRIAEQPWRILSSAFLHFGPMHVLFNGMALIALGKFLERVIGSARFVVLYAVAAAAGGIASALLSDARYSVGASGAVWGLLGAELVMTLRPGFLPEPVRLRARQAAWPPLLMNLAISFMPGIDLWAHLGGGAAGAALVLSGLLGAGRVTGEGPRAGVFIRGLAAACAALMLGALLWGWNVERPWEPLDAMRLLQMSAVQPE